MNQKKIYLCIRIIVAILYSVKNILCVDVMNYQCQSNIVQCSRHKLKKANRLTRIHKVSPKSVFRHDTKRQHSSVTLISSHDTTGICHMVLITFFFYPSDNPKMSLVTHLQTHSQHVQTSLLDQSEEDSNWFSLSGQQQDCFCIINPGYQYCWVCHRFSCKSQTLWFDAMAHRQGGQNSHHKCRIMTHILMLDLNLIHFEMQHLKIPRRNTW